MKILLFLSLILSIAVAVEARDKIRLITVDWPPYYSAELPEQGFYSQITREVFKRAGYSVEIYFVPWQRALFEAEQGNYDGLLGAYYSDERAKKFLFTDQVSANDEVFIVRADSKIDSIEKAISHTVAGMKGSAPLEELKTRNVPVMENLNIQQNLQMLAAGRVNVIIGGRAQFYYQLSTNADLRKLSPDDFKVIEPPYKSFGLFNAMTMKNPDSAFIVRAFNRALRDMKEDGSLAEFDITIVQTQVEIQ
ncbi:ABC transporter substrate-binding protein [Reinekea sp. G2M2-21]|uniref:substrate-binding periplasmic protein n=1 Tax=Reinekea sp. G2M2-21 TaxID=2788942 RepID=UPI0018A9B628|nr:transporter substrate-binding domain-containing protein [Reinekea sp. G2M2-21]